MISVKCLKAVSFTSRSHQGAPPPDPTATKAAFRPRPDDRFRLPQTEPPSSNVCRRDCVWSNDSYVNVAKIPQECRKSDTFNYRPMSRYLCREPHMKPSQYNVHKLRSANGVQVSPVEKRSHQLSKHSVYDDLIHSDESNTAGNTADLNQLTLWTRSSSQPCAWSVHACHVKVSSINKSVSGLA
jgi:hypothetical protein